jgi:hypothetical protein
VRWELQAEDTWLRCGPTATFEPDAQERMYRWAHERQLQTRQVSPPRLAPR